jgi:hypothetical protein
MRTEGLDNGHPLWRPRDNLIVISEREKNVR